MGEGEAQANDKHRGGGAGRTWASRLFTLLQGILAPGSPQLSPSTAFWDGLGFLLRGAHEQGVVLLQEVSQLRQLPVKEVDGAVHLAHAPQHAQP